MRLKPVSFADIKGWDIDNHEAALDVFIKSCDNFDHKAWQNFKKAFFSNETDKEITVKDLNCPKAKFYKNNKSAAKKFFEENFLPYLIFNNDSKEGLFTGYYELEIPASLSKSKDFIYPIYKKPDFIEQQSFSRKEIEQGALDNKTLEIAYTNDRLRLFLLHIQGSGILAFPTKKQRISYEANNKHKYSSIGKYIRNLERLDKGIINTEFILKYLDNNPSKLNDILYHNKSYVFFKPNENLSPIGAQQLPLKAERSLAIDRNFFPLGVPIFLNTNYPLTKSEYNKLMIAQDTGGAIKGPIRGDIYFGSGENAERNAFYMKEKGKYYLLLPNKFNIDKNKYSMSIKNY